MPTPKRSWLAGVIAAALVLAACGGSGPNDETSADTTSTSSTTSVSTAGTSLDVSSTGDSTATTSSAPDVTTAVPNPAAPPTPATSAPTSPPANPGTRQPREPLTAGTYRYDTDGDTTVSGGVSQTRPVPAVTTLRAHSPSSGQQRITRDLRESNGNGQITETTVQFNAEGIRLVRIKTTTSYAGITDVREFVPDPRPLVAPTKLEPGTRDEFTMNGTGTTARVVIEMVGYDQTVINGTAIRSFHVRTATTFSGDVDGTHTADTWYEPTSWLAIREEVDVDARTGLNRYQANYTATLQQLAPS